MGAIDKTAPAGVVPVIQADRERAAGMWRSLGLSIGWQDWQVDWMADGTADTGPIVQAFAAHRLAHEAPTAGVREAIGAAIDSFASGMLHSEKIDAILAALSGSASDAGVDWKARHEAQLHETQRAWNERDGWKLRYERLERATPLRAPEAGASEVEREDD